MQGVSNRRYEASPGSQPAGPEVAQASTLEWQPPKPRAEDLGRQATAQNIRVASIDVEPRSLDILRDALHAEPKVLSGARERLQSIRALHYLSVVVFTDERYDPTLVIEVNVDGPMGPFWADLEGAMGAELRAILRCCKRPGGSAGAIFDRVIAPDSKMPLAPLMEAISRPPAAWHIGNRGMSRARIEAEAAVFHDARKIVDRPNAFAKATASQIHQTLRQQLLRDHPCLASPAPPRFSILDQLDWVLAALFAAGLLLVLALPAILFVWTLWPPAHWIRSMLPSWICPWALGPSGIMAVVIGLCFWWLDGRWGKPVERQMKRPKGHRRPLLWTVLIVFVLAVVAGLTWWTRFVLPAAKQPHGLAILSLAAPIVLGIFASCLFVVARLRHLEESDAWQNAPLLDMRAERAIATAEDRSPQNHMASLVHVKPGGLRAILPRLGLIGLGLAIRLESRARRGYLVNVRTIHFAHLTLLNNRSRLLFLSNFDGTWDNYLADFIEKVRVPLNLVWTSGVGFPPTRFYVFEGVMHGRLFKVWKRRSMAPTLFWFCAYPEISVEQVWRQAQVADGLRRKKLTPKEAAEWAMEL
jgi:hypothetical protein